MEKHPSFSCKPILRDSSRKDGRGSLCLQVIINRKRKLKALGWYLEAEHWNADRCEPRKTAPNYRQLLILLKQEQTKVEGRILDLMASKKAFTLDDVFKESEKNQEPDFIEFCKGLLRERSKELATNTQNSHRSRLGQLIEFAGDKLPVSHITPNFLDRYYRWMIDEKENDHNGAMMKIKYIRLNLKVMNEREITSVYPFHVWKIKMERPDQVDYLSNEEINKMYSLWESGTLDDYMQNALHICLLGAYTGFRHCDYKEFNRFDGSQEFIEIVQSKTDERVKIPLHPRAKLLLSKHFRVFSYDKTRLYIKKVVEAVGIEKRITPHSFRRTFATRMVDLNFDMRIIQEFLGHKDYRSTLCYAKVTDHKKTEMIAKFDY